MSHAGIAPRTLDPRQSAAFAPIASGGRPSLGRSGHRGRSAGASSLFLAPANMALSFGEAIRARSLAFPSHNGTPFDQASARSLFLATEIAQKHIPLIGKLLTKAAR